MSRAICILSVFASVVVCVADVLPRPATARVQSRSGEEHGEATRATIQQHDIARQPRLMLDLASSSTLKAGGSVTRPQTEAAGDAREDAAVTVTRGSQPVAAAAAAVGSVTDETYELIGAAVTRAQSAGPEAGAAATREQPAANAVSREAGGAVLQPAASVEARDYFDVTMTRPQLAATADAQAEAGAAVTRAPAATDTREEPVVAVARAQHAVLEVREVADGAVEHTQPTAAAHAREEAGAAVSRTQLAATDGLREEEGAAAFYARPKLADLTEVATTSPALRSRSPARGARPASAEVDAAVARAQVIREGDQAVEHIEHVQVSPSGDFVVEEELNDAELKTVRGESASVAGVEAASSGAVVREHKIEVSPEGEFVAEEEEAMRVRGESVARGDQTASALGGVMRPTSGVSAASADVAAARTVTRR